MNNNSNTIAALIAGLAAGAALGILFAAGKGEETQDRLSQALADLKDKIADNAMQEIEKLTAASEGLANKVKDKFGEVKEEVSEKTTEA